MEITISGKDEKLLDQVEDLAKRLGLETSRKGNKTYQNKNEHHALF